MDSKPTYIELEQKITELTTRIQHQLGVENQYRNLVDSTSDSLYLVDAEGRYLFMNNNHANRLNISRISLKNDIAYQDFHTKEQNSEFLSNVRTVYETGISVHDEHQSNRDNRYFLRTFSPVKSNMDQKKIIAVSVVSKDITERRKIEEALQKSEFKYRQLIEHSNEAIFILTGGKFNYVNNRTEKMVGYPLEDLRLIAFINLVLSEDREMVFERQKSILQGDNSGTPFNFRIINQEGTTIWVEVSSVSITWEGSTSTLNFMRDITKQKRTETRLLQAQKMESIGTLAGGIAHDFNNLLMGIQGHASLALIKLGKDDPNHDHIKAIERLVASGANLTKQLLGFARGGKYEVKRIDLNDLIHKTSLTIGRTKKELCIHRNLESTLWPTDVDKTQIEQVLMNLFINAWQAMPGGGDLYIETKNVFVEESRFKAFSGKRGHYVKISITDTGVGMDEKTRERIFEPFFTTREMGRGTGLGLASAYGIIKNHNGFINVYSEEGKGSTFNIYIPASIQKDAREVYTNADDSFDTSLGTETILLVDDETMILDVAGDMLRTMGYTVLTASDGPTALEMYRQNLSEIDLVILDMVMPDMSGGELFDEIKTISPDARVLLSSGYSLNGQASSIIERGCDGFIQKPFTIGDLSRQLRGILKASPKQPASESEQLALPIFDAP